ncbi:DUF1700 domain-containing protein [Peptostreptococcaceae bacterium AGR-M142]
MTKQDYMDELYDLLRNIDDRQRKKILYEYEDCFNTFMDQGKHVDEIVKIIGTPKEVARRYDVKIFNIDRLSGDSSGFGIKAIIAFIALMFFNITFVLGPYISVLVLAFCILIVALCFIFIGIAVPLAIVLEPLLGFTGYININMNFQNQALGNLGLVFGGIALLFLGVVLILLGIKAIKFIFNLTKAYILFNVRLIKSV